MACPDFIGFIPFIFNGKINQGGGGGENAACALPMCINLQCHKCACTNKPYLPPAASAKGFLCDCLDDRAAAGFLCTGRYEVKLPETAHDMIRVCDEHCLQVVASHMTATISG